MHMLTVQPAGIHSTLLTLQVLLSAAFVSQHFVQTQALTHTLHSVIAQSCGVVSFECAQTLLDCTAGMDSEDLVGPYCQCYNH